MIAVTRRSLRQNGFGTYAPAKGVFLAVRTPLPRQTRSISSASEGGVWKGSVPMQMAGRSPSSDGSYGNGLEGNEWPSITRQRPKQSIERATRSAAALAYGSKYAGPSTSKL